LGELLHGHPQQLAGMRGLGLLHGLVLQPDRVSAPELVAERPANVQLTRSIPAPFKQLLKEQLGFGGYRIGELYPRRTRRAVAVNWLLAHLAGQGEPLAEAGPLPPLLDAPADPVAGHPGDRPVG
jgi:hypothetical protein